MEIKSAKSIPEAKMAAILILEMTFLGFFEETIKHSLRQMEYNSKYGIKYQLIGGLKDGKFKKIDLMVNLKSITEKIKTIRVAPNAEIYNPFVALGVGASETMHSKFIADLLNPKGLHNQGDLFLKCFLKSIGLPYLDIKNPLVSTEKDCGDGRIDIAIEETYNDKLEKIIIIENKLWASDQVGQLEKYYNYALKRTKSEKNVAMLYLTPYGKNPSPESIGKNVTGKYQCISYREHIINWLESCKSLALSNELRVSLGFYTNLIKQVISMTDPFIKLKEEIFKICTEEYPEDNVYKSLLPDSGEEIVIEDVGDFYIYPNEIYAQDKKGNVIDASHLPISNLLTASCVDEIINKHHLHNYVVACVEHMQ